MAEPKQLSTVEVKQIEGYHKEMESVDSVRTALQWQHIDAMLSHIAWLEGETQELRATIVRLTQEPYDEEK